MDILISIIIPIFNAGKKLSKMLDCVINQTFQEYEVILINDGSIDNSGKIIDKVAYKDNRFIAIHQKNKGVSFARNRGIKESRGKYITFLDADDEIPDDYLEHLILSQNETSADIVCCDVVMISNGKETSRFTYHNSCLTKTQALNFLLSREFINSGPCAKLFRSTEIKDIEFPNLRAYEDILFITKAFERANMIAVINNTEYRYIQNSNGTMSKFSASPSTDIVIASEYLVHFIKRHKNLSSKCFYITLSHLMQYLQMIDKQDKRNTFRKETRKLFRHNVINILSCNSFPLKEKLLFIMSAFI